MMVGITLRKYIIVCVVTVFLISFSACSGLDVVGNDSIRAFGDVLEVIPAEGDADNGWKITAPDSSASFSWDNKTFGMLIDIQPFVDAGLDISKLDNANENGFVYFSPAFNMQNSDVQSTSLKQFDKDIKTSRDSLNYHTSLDHYGIKLGDGNMFEWAKDMKINGYDKTNQDKDIVFVLNPQPLIAAGADPEKVEGWVYTEVQVEENGKPTKVLKLLKPFDLK